MSVKLEICESFKTVHHYGQPCFLNENNQPQCTYETTEEECGINLSGLPHSNQTQTFFDIARRTGSSTILSQKDVSALFDDARTLIRKLMPKEEVAPKADSNGMNFPDYLNQLYPESSSYGRLR